MRIAYLDCFSGISGDMFLGAAVDAGVPLAQLASVASALGLDTELMANRTLRGGISATKIDVLVHGRADRPHDEAEAHSHPHSHDPSHAHAHDYPSTPTSGVPGTPHSPEHSHGHAHEHSHEHGAHSHHHEPATNQAAHSHVPHVHRGLKEIREIIAHAPISSNARAFAMKAFELLAEAEGKIHNSDPESIHFHEVGSEDAIVDIVCAAVAVEAIGAERWYCSALNVGSGTVQSAHGVLPVPAPATAELLRGAPVYSSGVSKELLTPTGAAILRALDVQFEPLPRVTLSSTGYGAGARDFPGAANVVRLMVGEAGASQVSAAKEAAQNISEMKPGHTASEENADTITVLEANLDDMNPQLFGYVQQKLLDAGALDAFGVPVQMKKGRPGIVFTVLSAAAQADALAHILLTETTTLGVRMRQERRQILEREHVTVESGWGPIRIKLGRLRPSTPVTGAPGSPLQGEIVNCAPEFEDCRRIAEAHGVPLKSVMQEALRLYASLSNVAPGPALEAQNAGAASDDRPSKPTAGLPGAPLPNVF